MALIFVLYRIRPKVAPLFECVHKRDKNTGDWIRAYRQFSPGSRFPKRKNLRGRDEAPAFLANLDFTPDVYFFDSPESGFRVLAEGLRQKGALVYFEPEGKVQEAKLIAAIRMSDVIKFSDEDSLTLTSAKTSQTSCLFRQWAVKVSASPFVEASGRRLPLCRMTTL